MSLDGLMCLVEPDTANPPGVIRRVSAAGGSRDMPIDAEEYEVRATIDATFAFNVGDDGRERATAALSVHRVAKTRGQQKAPVTIAIVIALSLPV